MRIPKALIGLVTAAMLLVVPSDAAVNVTLNGVSYSIPEPGDTAWGQNLTDYLVATGSGLLQKAGGAFTLTADVDFGNSFGLKSTYYKTRATNPATAGQFRLGNAESISWRNNANTSNLPLSVNSSDVLTFNGNPIQSGISVSDTSTIDLTFTSNTLSADVIAGSLTNTQINSSAAIAYSKLNLSGSIVNADVNSSAAIAYSKLALSNSIVNADVNSSAAIARSKIASGTANQVIINDSGGVLSSEANLAISRGGTGAGTKSSGFDALSPMSASGDLIYGGASGTGTRLPKGSNGQVLTLASGIPSWANVGTSTAPLVTKYTSGSGTHTLTGSPLYIHVRALGGGGGGDGSYNTAGSAPTGAAAGGDTTFGTSLIVAGKGSAGAAGAAGGAGGSASLGTGPTGIAIPGAAGNGGSNFLATASNTNVSGSQGGSSALGGAGNASTGTSTAGTATTNSGSGGGGAGIQTSTVNPTKTGAAGGAGGFVDAIITSPNSTYSYAVGAGGAGGSGGTGGGAGGAGAAGIIEVTEYYQ